METNEQFKKRILANRAKEAKAKKVEAAEDEELDAFRYYTAAHYCAGRFSLAAGCLLLHLAGNASTDPETEGECFPSYDYLKTMSPLKSDATIARAINELYNAGVMHKKRRFSTSTKYFLRLEVMEKLAIPYLTRRKRAVVAWCTMGKGDECRAGAFVEEPMPEHFYFLCNADRHFYDVLRWRYQQLTDFIFVTKHPDSKVCGVDMKDKDKLPYLFEEWIHFIICEEPGAFGYRECRTLYFKSIHEEETPMPEGFFDSFKPENQPKIDEADKTMVATKRKLSPEHLQKMAEGRKKAQLRKKQKKDEIDAELAEIAAATL